MKSRPETKNIPIIVLSAYSSAANREKAFAAGCDEFEAKPVNFEGLIEKIRSVLSRSAQP